MAAPAMLPGLGFAITLPPNWFELDVHPGTRDARIRTLVEQRVREVPELREHRSTIVRLLREYATRAWNSGAVYCGVMAEPVDEGVLTASVTVSVLRAPSDDWSDAETAARQLLEALREKEMVEPTQPWCQVGLVDLAEIAGVAQARGVDDVEVDEGRWVRVVSMQTFVPVPSMNRVMAVSCSSPVLGFVEPMLDLFGAITESFRLRGSELYTEPGAGAL